MTDTSTVKVLKKRGRKPKNKLPDDIQIKEEPIESEKEVIIAYLPINLNDMEVKEEKEENYNRFDDKDNNIFIKSESQLKNNIINDSSSESFLKDKIDMLSLSTDTDDFTSNGIYINKINIHNVIFNQDTKCWWCKNSFNTPNLMLPEYYSNGIFYCIGNFCSFNCKKAYNIDLNDTNVWKRESLINLEYYLTYGNHKDITNAPSWLTLKEYGGSLSIVDFRKNFDTNSSEYILLQPPLISRQMQIEESYKKSNTNGPINKLDKLFDTAPTYLLKRSKPVETSQLNLEKTMGLKRKIK
jgi:hypothetical protein